MPQEVVIHDGNWQQFLSPTVDGEVKGHGCIPRDYNSYPRGCYPWAKAVDIPLIPRTEWSQRIKDKVAAKSQNSDIRMTGNSGQMIPSRDQNGRGYCWAHSGVSAHLVVRALMNEPYLDFSAYAIACIIKDYADEGGWGAQGVDWQVKNGVPTSQFWPQQSVSPSNNNAAMHANAGLHKITDQWADLSTGEAERDLTFDQEITLYLSNCPGVKDENWWSHSICGLDAVDGAAQYGLTRMDSGKLATVQEHDRIWAMDHPVTGGIGVRIWNSWGDDWSDHGMGVLTGSKAVSDGMVAPYGVMASQG